MTIERADFDAIAHADLEELVNAQVPEGIRLEFKQELYGKNDAAKRELLKDVSSFANSHGGHLLLGIRAQNGVAAELAGVECSDPDAELQHMEQVIRSGIEPALLGIRLKTVSLDSGRNIFILRIPRSWRPPHRVVAKGLNRFHVRNSAGVHEPGVEELRALFNQSSSALEHARRFRDQRIAAVCSKENADPLTRSRLFLHLVPVAASSGMFSLDLEAAHAQQMRFRPLDNMGMSPRFNYDGFVNEGDAGKYTQLFRDGCLEAVLGGIVKEDRQLPLHIPGLFLESVLFGALPPYLDGLRKLGVPPPLFIMVSLSGVRDAHYIVRNNRVGGWGPGLPEDVLRLPEGFLEDYGETVDYHRAVRPAFDALWNAIGYPRSQFFDEDGLWIGEKGGGY